MRRGPLALALATVLSASWTLLPVGAGSQSPGSTSWLSTGLPPPLEGASASAPAISADGTTVAFTATAPTQTGRSGQGRSEVFVHDSRRVEGGQLEQISVASDGLASPAGSSREPSVSCDGRFVAFTSEAAFDPDDRDGGAPDVYVRDRVLGTTELVSGGVPHDDLGVVVSGTAGSPAISADGRYVAMVATAVQQTRVAASQVYVYDRVEQVAKLVSRPSGGVDAASRDSFGPAISADGGVVVFASNAQLEGGDLQQDPVPARIFVWRRAEDSVKPVTVAVTGGRPNGPCGPPAVSQGGRLVAYTCLADNLVPGDLNGTGDVFVTDLTAGTTTLVSVDSRGQQANGDSCGPLEPGGCDARVSISGEGRFVAFASAATNLLGGGVQESDGIVPAQLQTGGGRDFNNVSDAFVRDLDERRTSRVSVLATGAEVTDGASGQPAIAYGGRRTAFVSTSRALTDGQCHPQNCPPNVFARSDPRVCFPCPAPECGPPPAVAAVRVNQDIVREGRVVTAFGSNFPPSVAVDVVVDGRAATVTSDATGAFELPVLVPHGSLPGPQQVRATAGTRSARDSFFVVRRSAQPPFPEIS